MQENKAPTVVDELPVQFDSLESLGEFWDTHSTADYEEWMEPVAMEFAITSGTTDRARSIKIRLSQ